MLLKREWDVVLFSPPLSLSLSQSLSHKSNLLNSCLHSEIILRLFFTVAAQWWICKHLLSFFYFFVRCSCLAKNPTVSKAQRGLKGTLGREVAQWDSVLNILRRGVESPLLATTPFAGTSNDGRLPHLSQQEHIYISSPQGILEDEVSSNWIWISLHQG